MALLTPFPQINSANALSDPLHQVCVRNKPSLNKTQPCPEGSAGLIHPGMAPAAALTLPLDTWGFATVSVTLKHLLSWSCCWNRGGAELQLAQGSVCFFAQQGLFHQHLETEQWKGGIQTHRCLTRRAPPGLCCSILAAGVSHHPGDGASVPQDFLCTDISTSDAKKSPLFPHPLQSAAPASVRQHSWIFQVLRKRKSFLPPNSIKCWHKLWQFLYDTKVLKGEAEMQMLWNKDCVLHHCFGNPLKKNNSDHLLCKANQEKGEMPGKEVLWLECQETSHQVLAFSGEEKYVVMYCKTGGKVFLWFFFPQKSQLKSSHSI